MANSASERHIQLHNFTIRSSLPLPKVLRHPSRLALQFLVNGIGEKEVLNTRGNTEHESWEVAGDVKICENEWLTATILVYIEESTKELGTVPVSYSRLLARAEARPRECHEFIVDGSTSSALMFITCYVRILSLPRKQHISAGPISSSGKSKFDEGHSSSNRAVGPGVSSTPSIADLECCYCQANSLPAERKPQALNAIGCAYRSMYFTTHELGHLEKAIAILDEALQIARSHTTLPKYLCDLAVCFLFRFERAGSQDDIEHAVSKSQDALHIVEMSNPDRHLYILHHGNALLARYKCRGKLEDLQSSISFMSAAEGLISDSHPYKPDCLNRLGSALVRRFERLGRIEDLGMAIALVQKAVDLTPDGHPDGPSRFNNLADVLATRFDRFGRVEDLELAFAYKRKAAGLTPDGYPHKPSYLNKLGSTSVTQSNQLGRIEDLELAIAQKEMIVNQTPDGHPDKPARLNNLGTAIGTRYDRLGRAEDLELAIVLDQKALDLTPDGHPHKPSYIDSLGSAFTTRFDRFGRVEDLQTAIAYKQKALALIPDGHLHKPQCLNGLGSAFMIRSELLGRVEDLEMSIAHSQKAVNLTPDSHPEKPTFLTNLGNAFMIRFRRFSHFKDLELAIVHNQKAVDLMPDGLLDKPRCHHNLGIALETQYDWLGRIEDLELAMAHMQKAVDLTPDAHPNKPRYLNMLGKTLTSRCILLKQVKDLHMAVIQFSTAASLSTGRPMDRIKATRYWANLSQILENYGVPNSSPLEPYRVAVDLLPRVAWLGIPMSTQHALLEEVGGIVREAVSDAIRLEEYETAVEWAEAGRSIVWQNLLNLRTPVDELRSVHSDLADRLETISRQLDMSVRGNDGTMNGVTHEVEEVSRSHVQLALDWDNTLDDIRSKSGFESFLKPKGFSQLGHIARDGPVVILNIPDFPKYRCDALLLIPEDNGDIYISNILLGDFSYAKSEALLKGLKGLLSSKHLRAREGRKAKRMPIDDGIGSPLEHVLRCLWLDVVKPIIEYLAYPPRSTDLPHIWWCATGPLAFLPIHAAGLYDTDEVGSKLSDYVVSSYTPTLSALLDDSNPSQDDFRLLAVAQANAPGTSAIPNTEVEVKKIQTLAGNVNVIAMTKEDATVENVWQGMEKSSWVHLACHGQQNIKEPIKSGLLLHDGTLELQRLIKKPLPRADFAFLSACQTATGDEGLAEESLHLAAGMLFAGYKGVIATMWSIMDDVGPRVAEDVYRVMLKDGKPNRKAAAHALHEAVRQLREDPKVDMLHWVPFIHIGR